VKSSAGVATKYLGSYLSWRRMIDSDGDDAPASRYLIAASAWGYVKVEQSQQK
jgi:hypothetical protein